MVNFSTTLFSSRHSDVGHFLNLCATAPPQLFLANIFAPSKAELSRIFKKNFSHNLFVTVNVPDSCLTSPVSCLLSLASRLLYLASCMYHIYWLTSPVSRLLSPVSCLTSSISGFLPTPPVSLLQSNVMSHKHI